MRRLIPFLTLLVAFCFAAFTAQAQIVSDTLTIQEIQQVDPDTLAAGNLNSPRVGDTITVEGVVYAAPRISTGGSTLFTLGNAFTMYIMDPNGGAWSGLNVRASDSLAADAILITAVDTGYVVRVTGVVSQYYSTTQFEIGVGANGAWNADVLVEILDDLGKRPDPTEITIDELVAGGPQDGINSGQQYEGVYAVIKGAKVGSVNLNSSTGRYTWTLQDGSGNSIGVYDQSVYFRGGSQGVDPSWAPPAPGTTISAIRGVITSSSQGIVISPIYPDDMVLGSFPPAVTDLMRDITIPKSTEAVTVTCNVEDTNQDGSITDVTLVYGKHDAGNDVEIDRVTMTYDGTTMEASGQIPVQADGSIIWYYIEATDNDNETVVFPGDIVTGKPFYMVRDGDLHIRDIQYTPYSNGNSGAVGGEVTLRGTVVSGASDLGMVFIQDDTAPWSGIMVRGDEAVRALETGQDITITGTVEERYNVTTIGESTITTDHGTATVPEPVLLTTGQFETDVVSDGTADAEKWEGMLAVFEELLVTSDNADEGSGNYGEILVDDGSGDMRVDDAGVWSDTYTNDPTETGKTYLGPGTTIDPLIGIVYFAFGNYKLEPRSDSDVGDIGVEENPPVISDLERDIAIPTSSDAVEVTCMVEDSNDGGTIALVTVVYGSDDTETGRVDLTYDETAKTATGIIPALNDGDVVWYYIEAKDNDDEMATYPEDLTGSRPFFIVRDGDVRIRDIKYTPYDDGVPGCTGFEGITTRGVLTAGPNLGMYFIQDASAMWSGIQIYASDIKDQGLALGDDITVTGKVGVRYDMVQLSDAVVDTNHGNVELPAPMVVTTGAFENDVVPNGAMTAEPYEGLLVSFENLTVTSDNADAAAGKNYGEFLADDGSGDMRVDDAGTWGDVYTTDSTDTGLIYLKPGTTIASLSGVMYFAFGDWKLQPRDEDDFSDVVVSVTHTPGLPSGIALHQNYPNPFTADAGTSIRFALPKASDVTLRVYDISGKVVADLLQGSYSAGSYSVRFVAPNLPSGIYLYRLTVDGAQRTARMVITR